MNTAQGRGYKVARLKGSLRNKLEGVAETLPLPIARVFLDNAIVSGGSVSAMLMGDPVNDYDVYFRTEEAVRTIAEYYVDKYCGDSAEVVSSEFINIRGDTENRLTIRVKSEGIVRPEMPMGEITEHDPICFTDNAITLKGEVQLVIRFFGEPEQIHSTYDYAHCMGWYDQKSKELHTPVEALQAMMSKTLIYKGSLYPIASVFRLRKFLKRGWQISAGQLLKIVWQISKLDMNNLDVLKDQLIGVDTLYMKGLLSRLEEVKTDKIDEAYVMELLDEVFNET